MGELDTSNLHSGMMVKNYEEMCRLLNQDILAGNSKKAQLEQWRRYFDWENDGHKFIILTVYEEPIAGMLPDSAIYAKFMQLALMEAFDNINGGTYHFFATRLMERVGMVNEDYKQLISSEENRKEMFGPEGTQDKSKSILGADKVGAYGAPA